MSAPRLRVLDLPGGRYALVLDRAASVSDAHVDQFRGGAKRDPGCTYVVAFPFEVELGGDLAPLVDLPSGLGVSGQPTDQGMRISIDQGIREPVNQDARSVQLAELRRELWAALDREPGSDRDLIETVRNLREDRRVIDDELLTRLRETTGDTLARIRALIEPSAHERGTIAREVLRIIDEHTARLTSTNGHRP